MSVDLPEPETPVTQVRSPSGSSSVTFCRLLPRAPLMRMLCLGFAACRFADAHFAGLQVQPVVATHLRGRIQKSLDDAGRRCTLPSELFRALEHASPVRLERRAQPLGMAVCDL